MKDIRCFFCERQPKVKAGGHAEHKKLPKTQILNKLLIDREAHETESGPSFKGKLIAREKEHTL
jgi:phage FluMu protein Com